MNLTERLQAARTVTVPIIAVSSPAVKLKTSTAIAIIFGISTVVLAVQAGADWQYTDDKGKSHKVILKMDVPRQYSSTAVEVDGSAHGSNTVVPAGVPTLPVLIPEQQPTGPVVLVPGKMWWTYPEGSPERAAAQHEASAKAYSLRQQAGPTAATESADFMNASVLCQSAVNTRARYQPGGETLKAQAYADGSVSVLGDSQTKFAYEQCMANQGQAIQWK